MEMDTRAWEILSSDSDCDSCDGRGNPHGIATHCGLDSPGIDSRWVWGREIFRNLPDRPWVPPSLLYSGYRVVPGGKAAGACR